ncbi:hypothetical protein [Phormidium nigroviride]
MTNSPIEKLNLSDTQYADILLNSINPGFELGLIAQGVEPEEAKMKARLITLLTRKPETPEAWQELRKSWTETLGKEPTDKDFALISQIFWNNETTQH